MQHLAGHRVVRTRLTPVINLADARLSKAADAAPLTGSAFAGRQAGARNGHEEESRSSTLEGSP